MFKAQQRNRYHDMTWAYGGFTSVELWDAKTYLIREVGHMESEPLLLLLALMKLVLVLHLLSDAGCRNPVL